MQLSRWMVSCCLVWCCQFIDLQVLDRDFGKCRLCRSVALSLSRAHCWGCMNWFQSSCQAALQTTANASLMRRRCNRTCTDLWPDRTEKYSKEQRQFRQESYWQNAGMMLTGYRQILLTYRQDTCGYIHVWVTARIQPRYIQNTVKIQADKCMNLWVCIHLRNPSEIQAEFKHDTVNISLHSSEWGSICLQRKKFRVLLLEISVLTWS
jgi:hypothetical protein